jgi:hypothetical protein
MLGATRREAAAPVTREALRSALMPTINSMAVTGVVSLPGMMTGQILGGVPPAALEETYKVPRRSSDGTAMWREIQLIHAKSEVVQPEWQHIVVEFDKPQTITRLVYEVEEAMRERTQEIRVQVSEDGGGTYRQILVQEYNFSPSGATYQREE